MYVCMYINREKEREREREREGEREREREIAWGCLGTKIESSLMEEEMMRGVKSIFRLEWRKIKKRTLL